MDKFNIDDFYKGLDITLRKKNTVESERYLASSLDMAKKLGDVGGIIAVSNEMGGFLRTIGRLAEAGVVYSEVLKKLIQIGQGNTENYGVALINCGNVFIAAKEYSQALDIYRQAQDIFESLGLGNDYRMAALCNNISAIYREIGKLAEAENMARRAINIIAQSPNTKVELATSYINLGEVLVKSSKYIEARDSLNKAIEILLQEEQGKDPHLSSARAAMGQLEYTLGNYREAETQYICAMGLIERDFGRTPYYYIIEGNLNKVREKLR